MEDRTIVILAGAGGSTDIIYNSLKDGFRIKKVVIEEPVPRVQFLKKRIKKLGIFKVSGQILFQLFIIPFLRACSRKRTAELKKIFKLNDSPIDRSKIINVKSVNSDDTIDILKELAPGIVVINGTRIISKKVLNSIPAKFVNMHAGITPLYRGVHGAYWALVEKNKKACGVTVHFVDPGIDTGKILGQGIIDITKEDNFSTYPLIQLGIGMPLLKKAIEDIFEERVEIKPCPEGRSKLWSHPTLWGYLWNKVNNKLS